VDKGSVCWSRLTVRLEIALAYQTMGVRQVVRMQTCEYGNDYVTITDLIGQAVVLWDMTPNEI
jgi:hypothetical protein